MRPRDSRAVPRFLVVDDSPTIRATLRATLAKAMMATPDLVEAATMEEGIAAFAKGDFTLVFLDMILGEKGTGLAVAQAMLRERPGARVVLMTSLPADHPDVVDAIGMGAFALLHKPLRVEKVANILREVDEEDRNMQRIR